MALEQSFKVELKKRLEEEKLRLEKELGRFAKPTDVEGQYETRFEEIGNDWEENASEVEQYTDNVALEATLEHQLREVLDALDRMDRDSYGICEKGGEEISAERLRAYPAARNCVSHD